MGLFVTLLIVTVMLGFLFFFYLIKLDRYGWKPFIVTSISFVVCLVILIPLGNQPVISSDRNEMTEEEIDESIETLTRSLENEENKEDTTDEIESTSMSEPLVTKVKTDQIHEGMTYDKVLEIIGEEGTLERETRADYGIHTAYKWQNDDGSYASIQFIDRNNGTPEVASFRFVDLPEE